MELLTFLLALAIYTALRYLDIKSSRDFTFHGLTESKWFVRDQYKNFHEGKAVFVSTTCAVPAFVCVWLDLTYFGVAWLLITGGVSGLWHFLNEASKTKARKFQVQWLTEMRAIAVLTVFPPEPHEVDYLFQRLNPFITRRDRKFYGYFPWRYSTKELESEAITEVAKDLISLSRKSEDQWFR